MLGPIYHLEQAERLLDETGAAIQLPGAGQPVDPRAYALLKLAMERRELAATMLEFDVRPTSYDVP